MLPYETHLKLFFAVWSITEISGHSKYCQIPKFLKKFHLNIFIVIFESRFSNWLHITHFVHDVTNVIIKCTTFKKTFSSAQILEKCCPVSLLTRLLHYAKLLVHTPSVSDDLMCHNNIHNRDKWKNTVIMFFHVVVFGVPYRTCPGRQTGYSKLFTGLTALLTQDLL